MGHCCRCATQGQTLGHPVCYPFSLGRTVYSTRGAIPETLPSPQHLSHVEFWSQGLPRALAKDRVIQGKPLSIGTQGRSWFETSCPLWVSHGPCVGSLWLCLGPV